MYRINNIEYRNLEEQVLENKQKIAEHYNIDRVLADFGIKVIGQVDSAADLPDPTGDFEYGDAYAVGVTEPYSFYIYTRPDPNTGHDSNWWFDIGQLAIVGPQGPQGPEGPQGAQGTASEWYTSLPENATIGDMSLASNGDVYRYTENGWSLFTNIKGPQGATGATGARGPEGPQGPNGLQGPQGEPGRGFIILGNIEAVDLLPAPSEYYRDKGYVVGSSLENGELFLVQGEPGNLSWHDYGPFPTVSTTGTTVYKDGVAQTTYNTANVYDHAITDTSLRILCKENGAWGTKGARESASAYSIPLRGNKGQIKVYCGDDSEDEAAVNKAYFKANILSSANSSSAPMVPIKLQNNGGWGNKYITENAGNYSIAAYDGSGILTSKATTLRRAYGNRTVTEASSVITKNWYNATPTKLVDFDNSQSVTVNDYNGEEWGIQGNREFWYWDNNLESYYYIGKMAFGLAAANLEPVYCSANYDGTARITIEYIAQSGQLNFTNTRTGYGSIYIL